jgi:hypothetical protein
MSDTVQTAIVEILKRIQSDLADIKCRVERIEPDVTDIKGRVERLETMAVKQRRDQAAMLVMMRGVVGVFEDRMSTVDADLQNLKPAP